MLMDSFGVRNKKIKQVRTFDSQMKRDHLGFFIFLALLLLAPEIPFRKLGFQLVPELSSLSLGALGLAIWVFVSPQYITRINAGVLWSDSLLLVSFGLYAFIVSLVSLKPVAIVYAAQYIFYLVFGYLMLSAYFKKLATHDKLKVALDIMAFVFFIYSFGVIISVFTGPFYPYQVQFYKRTWGDVAITQGVGFSDSANGAGAILIVINSFFWFAYQHKGKLSLILVTISFLALLLTFSRSAVFGYIIGVVFLYFLLILRILVRPHNSKEELRIVIGISSLLVTVFLLLIIVSVLKLNYFRSLVLGFGITGTEILDLDLLTRFDLWKAGIKAYLNNGFISQIIGNGFRNTDYVDELGAWITPHNFYINSLGDFGIIGTTLFIVSFAIFIIKAVSNILVSNGMEIFKFSFVAIIALLIMNMTEVFFYSPTLITMTLLIFLLQSVYILFARKENIRIDGLDK